MERQGWWKGENKRQKVRGGEKEIAGGRKRMKEIDRGFLKDVERTREGTIQIKWD